MDGLRAVLFVLCLEHGFVACEVDIRFLPAFAHRRREGVFGRAVQFAAGKVKLVLVFYVHEQLAHRVDEHGACRAMGLYVCFFP